MKELLNFFGDLIVTKHASQEVPVKLGEESALLGIANTCTFITRSWTPLITFDAKEFFKIIIEAGTDAVVQMRERCALKLKSTVTQFNVKLAAEVIKEDIGFLARNRRIIPAQEDHIRAQE